MCLLAGAVHPGTGVWDIEQSEELCLFDFVAHIAVVICWEDPFAQREEDVFVETSWIIDGTCTPEQLQFSLAVIVNIGT
jgi:hypothetical protein